MQRVSLVGTVEHGQPTWSLSMLAGCPPGSAAVPRGAGAPCLYCSSCNRRILSSSLTRQHRCPQECMKRNVEWACRFHTACCGKGEGYNAVAALQEQGFSPTVAQPF